jgi:thiamine-phosphate pyrophosphorylase
MDFARPNLTLVIDRQLYRPSVDGTPPLSLVEAAIDGGVTMVQLRLSERRTGDELATEAIALRLREIAANRVPFLVTADLELADRCRADGVVLIGQRSYRPLAAKEYLRRPDGAIVGWYADSVASASRAERGGADFVQIDPYFDETSAEPLALLRKVKDAIHLPLIAFGSIDSPERAQAALEAGADGIAVSQAILEAPDPRAAAAALLAAMH